MYQKKTAMSWKSCHIPKIDERHKQRQSYLESQLVFMRCFVYLLHTLTCHCHSSSIQTCQRCSRSRRASTACSSGTHEPIMIRGRCERYIVETQTSTVKDLHYQCFFYIFRKSRLKPTRKAVNYVQAYHNGTNLFLYRKHIHNKATCLRCRLVDMI